VKRSGTDSQPGNLGCGNASEYANNNRQLRIVSMRTSHSNTRPLIAGLCVLLMGAWAFPARGQVTAIQVGSPTWYPAGCVQLAAPIGTFDNGFADFPISAAKLLPSPNHEILMPYGIVPGVAHTGFDTELPAGLAASGFKGGTVFTPQDFRLPNAVWLAMMIVAGPNAPQGATPDYTLGPTIPGPINFTSSDTYRNGVWFDGSGSWSVPPLQDFDPRYAGLSHSHFPSFYADAMDWAPPDVTDPAGDYEYRITVRDEAGNGWDITANFIVVPEPATCALLTGLGLLAFAWQRRRA
jgi:hypothetical protein